MNKPRLDGITRVMTVLRQIERVKGQWPAHEVDTPDRDWKWPEEIAYDLFMEAEAKLEAALVALSTGESSNV